jgi:hypothetical protein
MAEAKKQTAARKMRPGGGRAKGGAFETKIAKLLSERLAPLKFIKTQGSGGRVGGKNFATIGQLFGEDALKLFVGDVVPANERDEGLAFRHSLELKFYKEPDSWGTLVSGTAKVFAWMDEARTDAARVGRNPLLIFKFNHHPEYVGLTDLDSAGTDGREIEEALHEADLAPKLTLLRYLPDGGTDLLDVYLLEDLLKVPGFWYRRVAPAVADPTPA